MKCVNMLFGMDISFNPSYYKKLGLKGKGFQQPLENTLDHGLHDAETIIKREVQDLDIPGPLLVINQLVIFKEALVKINLTL